MATTVTIDSVTTEDATPSVAPHRISALAGKNHADFTFTPTNSGGNPIRAVIIREGGVDPYTGTEVGRMGLVCSDSEPCSDGLPCTDWESPSGTQLSEDVKYSETGSPGDGSQTINVWAISTDGVWG